MRLALGRVKHVTIGARQRKGSPSRECSVFSLAARHGRVQVAARTRSSDPTLSGEPVKGGEK